LNDIKKIAVRSKTWTDADRDKVQNKISNYL
jgi:hypothetical protein